MVDSQRHYTGSKQIKFRKIFPKLTQKTLYTIDTIYLNKSLPTLSFNKILGSKKTYFRNVLYDLPLKDLLCLYQSKHQS